MKNKMHRFELALDGQPMDVGFLNGIGEIGMPESQETALLELFNALPCPHTLEVCGPCKFWFTDEGLERYITAVIAVMRTISEYNWQLLYGTFQENVHDKKRAVYRDSEQAAWLESYLQGTITFEEVKSIEVSSDGRCIIHTKKEEEI